MLDKTAWVAIGALFVTSLIAGGLLSRKMNELNPFTERGLLQRGSNLPPIWLFYNKGDMNARMWADFGARSSRALNIPYLNLAYEAIVRHNSDNYRVEVINGIAGLAEILGWETIPAPMRSLERAMNAREMNWVRAAVLARYGGLWLEPASVCVRGFGRLPADEIIFFGSDLAEMTSVVPGMRAVWAGSAGKAVFKEWADDEHTRISTTMGGDLEASEKASYMKFAHGKPGVSVNVHGECGRKGNRRIELDDLLSISEDGRLPFVLTEDAVYVPMIWDELTKRLQLNWFMRMSEEQIMESELVVKWLLTL